MTDNAHTHDDGNAHEAFPREREGRDGHNAIYRERVFPTIGMWSFTIAMTISLGIAYGRAYGVNTALAVGIATTSVAIVGMLVNSPVIVIDDTVLRAGNARLPLVHVGAVRVLNREATQEARTKRAHPDAYFSLRAGIKESVLVAVTDLEDPHPYWHIATRHPTKFAAALESLHE